MSAPLVLIKFCLALSRRNRFCVESSGLDEVLPGSLGGADFCVGLCGLDEMLPGSPGGTDFCVGTPGFGRSLAWRSPSGIDFWCGVFWVA